MRRILDEQAEAREMEKLMAPAEVKKRKKETRRHVQMKIIAGSAAGESVLTTIYEYRSFAYRNIVLASPY
jgi:hypothetical protein